MATVKSKSKPKTATRPAAARRSRPATAVPAPKRATRATLAFTLDDAIARGNTAVALVGREAVRARIERRLAAGTIERLGDDLHALDGGLTSKTIALTRQKAATGGTETTADIASAWLSATRRTARLAGASKALRTSLGVGSRVNVGSPKQLEAVVRAAAECLRSEKTRAELGLLPEDAARGLELADALASASTTATETRSGRKDVTRSRDAVQKSLEEGLRAISRAGTQEYFHPDDRDLHAEFVALLEEHASAPPKPAAPAPAKPP